MPIKFLVSEGDIWGSFGGGSAVFYGREDFSENSRDKQAQMFQVARFEE